MRKKLIALFLCVLLTFLCGCAQRETILHAESYGEAFRSKNAILYPNPNCEHQLISSSAKMYMNPEDCNWYHLTICKKGGCDYGIQFHPHVFRADALERAQVQPQNFFRSDCYFYHRFFISCAECGLRIDLHVPCKVQRQDCQTIETQRQNGCLDRNWEEILCDTPYEILYD